MTKSAYYSPDQYERYLGERWWQGAAFFETREDAKDAAKSVRKHIGIPCRAIVIPASGGLLGYDDRFLVMLPKYNLKRRWLSSAYNLLRKMGGET